MRGTGVMRVLLIAAATTGFVASAEVIAVDNGRLRVEFDTELFAIRYVGEPGGENLVTPLHVPNRLRGDGAGDRDPGGISFYIHFADTGRRVTGPAEIVAKSSTQLVLRSPEVDDAEARLHLELRLNDREPEAMLRLQIETELKEPFPAALATITTLAPRAALRVPKADATIRPALPEATTDALFVDAGDHLEIDNPRSHAHAGDAVAEFTCDSVTIAVELLWNRETTAAPGMTADAWRARYRRDSANRLRSLELASPTIETDLWTQPVMIERWRLIARGE